MDAKSRGAEFEIERLHGAKTSVKHRDGAERKVCSNRKEQVINKHLLVV